MSEDTEPLPEEEYLDLVDLEVTEDATIRLHSELLRATFTTYRNNSLQTGVSVTQDGANIAISAGTVNQDELPHFYAWCGVTPEQARTLGDAMYEAADKAEEAMAASREPKEDTRSFLQRLAGIRP